MNREAFWNNLERAYADQDNAQFDREHPAQRRDMIVVALGLISATFAGAFVYGLLLLNII